MKEINTRTLVAWLLWIMWELKCWLSALVLWLVVNVYCMWMWLCWKGRIEHGGESHGWKWQEPMRCVKLRWQESGYTLLEMIKVDAVRATGNDHYECGWPGWFGNLCNCKWLHCFAHICFCPYHDSLMSTVSYFHVMVVLKFYSFSW